MVDELHTEVVNAVWEFDLKCRALVEAYGDLQEKYYYRYAGAPQLLL